jgi:hypothetical protein
LGELHSLPMHALRDTVYDCDNGKARSCGDLLPTLMGAGRMRGKMERGRPAEG